MFMNRQENKNSDCTHEEKKRLLYTDDDRYVGNPAISIYVKIYILPFLRWSLQFRLVVWP